MKAFLAVLVVVLGATTAWLWLRIPTVHPQVESGTADESLRANDDPDLEEGEPGRGIGDNFVPGALPETVPAVAPSQQSRDRGDPRAVEQRLMQDKEYVDARRRLIGLTMEGRYPDIERVLEISPEAAERLFTVLADHRVQLQGKSGKGSDTDPAQLELEKQERKYARDTAISGVIGEARMPRYEEYVGSLFERYEVIGLQVELMNSEDPLEFDDAQPVIKAMYEERRRIERELEATHGVADADGEHPVSFVVDGRKIADLDAKSNDRIFAAAAQHLSPTQAKAFRRMIDNNAEMESLWNEIQRMRSAAKAGQSN